MDTPSLFEATTELNRRPKCSDWSSKVQLLCERFWKACEDGTATADVLEPVIALLNDRDTMMLVQLVIPELRGTPTEPLNSPYKAAILRATESIRAQIVRVESTTQADYDSALYRAEKDIYYEAEMHRVKLLLHHNNAFSAAEERALREWLDACPVQSPLAVQEHQKADGGSSKKASRDS